MLGSRVRPVVRRPGRERLRIADQLGAVSNPACQRLQVAAGADRRQPEDPLEILLQLSRALHHSIPLVPSRRSTD
eukprot:COSAG01_NODE_49345_length_373_cov_0.583942_1_plen_74_part_01